MKKTKNTTQKIVSFGFLFGLLFAGQQAFGSFHRDYVSVFQKRARMAKNKSGSPFKRFENRRAEKRQLEKNLRKDVARLISLFSESKSAAAAREAEKLKEAKAIALAAAADLLNQSRPEKSRRQKNSLKKKPLSREGSLPKTSRRKQTAKNKSAAAFGPAGFSQRRIH